MSRAITIVKVGDTTKVKIVENGKTTIYNSNSNRDLQPYDLGVIITNDPNEVVLNNYKIPIAELTNDGIDFTGITTGEQLADKLSSEKCFKYGGGLGSEEVSSLVYGILAGQEESFELIKYGWSVVEGLTEKFYAEVYKIDGVLYDQPEDLIVQDVTLDPAPATVGESRIDVFVFQTDATFDFVKGTEGIEYNKPQIDEDTQIEVTFEIITNGQTEIIGTTVTEDLIYDENIGSPSEYDITSIPATVSATSTDIAEFGTSLKFTETPHNSVLSLQKASINTFDYAMVLVFDVYLTDQWTLTGNNKTSLDLYLDLAGSSVSDRVRIIHGKFGLDASKLNEVQTLSVPLYLNNISGYQFDGITLKTKRTGNNTFYLNNARIQSGLQVNPSQTPTDNGVKEVVAGENVTVDATDPQRPIVHSTGSSVVAPLYRGGETVDLNESYHNKTIIMSGEFNQELLVPLESRISLPIGFRVNIVWRRSGKKTIVEDAGVTIFKDANEQLIIASENNAITLEKTDTNEWDIYGALAKTDDVPISKTYDDMLTVLTPSVDTVLSRVAYPNIFKSSDFPQFTTTQDYFIIYTTDHHVGGQGVYWGEMDDLEFTNFNERGVFLNTGFNYEMCRVYIVPSGESSVTTDEIWIIGHDISNPVQNFGVNGNQQTRLFTTNGGNAPHLCTWTDHGNPLGYDTDLHPQHTGYCEYYRRGLGDWVATHWMSNSVNGIDWSTTHGDSWVSFATDPAHNWVHHHAISGTHPSLIEWDYPQFYGMKFFTYNGKDYVAGHVGNTTIGIFDEWNEFLAPTNLVAQSQLIDGFNTLGWYFPSDNSGHYLWLITKNGGGVIFDTPFRIYKYDLRELLG